MRNTWGKKAVIVRSKREKGLGTNAQDDNPMSRKLKHSNTNAHTHTNTLSAIQTVTDTVQ